tara:strand:+ start:242 stop:421 length:180 start_codon:yes stop_codon:yes gene_type:complete
VSKKYNRSEYGSYKPNSPLTLHYISTGAILPEKEEEPTITKIKKRAPKRPLKQTNRKLF